MQEQLGQTERVCRKGPPVVVPIQQRHGMLLASVWPIVGEKIVCDAFDPELAS